MLQNILNKEIYTERNLIHIYVYLFFVFCKYILFLIVYIYYFIIYIYFKMRQTYNIEKKFYANLTRLFI